MSDVATRERTDSPSWTPHGVGERLVAAFRLLPNVPVFSLGCIAPNDPARPELQAAIDLIDATERHLGADSDARKKLLSWARARASGRSIAEICREMGWPRGSFERVRREALVTLATRLAGEPCSGEFPDHAALQR
jgi:hypothetical protein